MHSTFHWLMGVSIAVSFLIYVVTLFVFKDYFGEYGFMKSIIICTIMLMQGLLNMCS